MNKEEYNTLEEIKKIDDTLLNEIKIKEQEMKILEAELSQLYVFIKEVQHLAEIENIRINKLKESENNE